GRDAVGLERGRDAALSQTGLSVDPGRMPPDIHLAFLRPGRNGHAGGQLVETDGPFAAPHLEVDVDVVVVDLGQALDRVPDLERASLALGGVVPDDPGAPSQVPDSEGAGRGAASPIGARPVLVDGRPFRDRHLPDPLAGGEGYLAEATREGPVEPA